MTSKQESSWVKRNYRWWWIPLFLFFIGFIAMLSATTWINRPGGARWISQKLEQALGTQVELKSVHLGWFGDMEASGFLIRDHKRDTLIYADYLKTNLRSLYAPSSEKKLNLGAVTLQGGIFQLVHYKHDPYKNLKMTLNPGPADPDAPHGQPFTMNLKSLDVRDFVFYNIDERYGQFQSFRVDEGHIKVNELALDQNTIDLKQAYLHQVTTYLSKDSVLLQPKSISVDQSEADSVMRDGDSTDYKPFTLRIDDLIISDGDFKFDNNERSPNWTGQYHRIDYDHLHAFDVHVEAQDFVMKDLNFSARDAHLAFETPSGFLLEGLDADTLHVDEQSALLHGLIFQTPYTYLTDTLEFKYREYTDWQDFNNRVFIQADISSSVLAFRDIMHFAPELYDNTFFINAENQQMLVQGQFFGRVNSLKGRELVLQIEDEISFRGNISSRDLTLPQQQFFGAQIDDLTFDIQSLEKLIPNFKLPPNFEKLQDVKYKGRFDGYPLDFVTFGRVRSPLGVANLDMRLDLKNGPKAASYSGKISLDDFDLGIWSGNDDLGRLEMNLQVENGQGLSLETAEVTASGQVQEFVFKEHAYTNLELNGSLNKNSFDGFLRSTSEHANFVFNGLIDGLDSVPVYQFTADIRAIRLDQLNLSQKKFDFGGQTQVSFSGLNWKELIGAGAVQDFWILQEGQDTLQLDSVYVSQVERSGGRKLLIQSQSGGAELEGIYDLPTLHKDLLSIFQKAHPLLASKLGIKEQLFRDTLKYSYSLDLNWDDQKEIVSYFTNGFVKLDQVKLNAAINTANQSIKIVGDIPEWSIDQVDFEEAQLSLLEENGLMVYDYKSQEVFIGGKSFFSEVNHQGNFNGDGGEVSLTYIDPNHILKDINLNAEITPKDEVLSVTLDPAYFTYSGETWRFLPGNKIDFGKKKIFIEDLVFSSFRQVLTIDDYNEGRGLRVTAEEFSSDLLDSLARLKGFDFSGSFSASLGIDDIYKFEGINFELTQDDLYINNQEEGQLYVQLAGPSWKEGLKLNLDLKDDTKRLQAIGQVSASGYQMDIKAVDLPLVLLENIITSGISQTSGKASGELTLTGQKNEFDLTGALTATGRTRVDYIGVAYSFDNQVVNFIPGKLDFTDAVLKDPYGNAGTVQGYLYHRSFRDWGMNLSINTNNMLMLDTGPEDNSSYYGTAYGGGKVEFSGTFERPSIYVQADSRRGTSMVIPISYEGGNTRSDFVEFVQKDTLETETDSSNVALEGLEIELKLGITENANVKIIFDEQAGDVLQGSGRGNMVVKLARNGELTVYGEYEIESGDYLFTLLNFVNKPFVVQQGGKIRWTGDPVDAQIDLTAEYKDLSASPYPLIQEFASGNEDLSDAQRPTRVDLKMNLKGSLLRPLIDFDIRLPELVGETKTYVENKLQILRNDQQRLNQQVFGLVVLGSFLPASGQGGPGLANNIGSSTVNTLSEFLSTQLSLFVSGLLNDIVKDVNFISGVDVDLAYIQRYDIQASSNSFTDGEYQFRVRNRLWNDRWVVTLGGNYGNQSISAGDPYFNPETVLEWNTPIRGLKLRAYYRGEDSIQGQRQLVGGGIRYRKEFDTFAEFFNAMKRTDKEL